MSVDVSVVLPCLDEAETVGAVVDEAQRAIAAAGLRGEVIVVDNGSTDGSGEIAAARGARVVAESRRGYGREYRTGIDEARGDFVVLADADGTYPLSELARLIEPIRAGDCDLVLGSRLNGRMERGAMPWKNRWIGNPLLTGLLNLLFRSGVSDAHSGLRVARRDALTSLPLRTDGMEFASEMIVEAAKHGVRIAEVPIGYRARGGVSKLSPFRDAWRHVRYLLLRQPTALFVVPGLILFVLGLIPLLALAGGPVHVFGRDWEIHTAIVGAIATLVGAQIVQLGTFARTYAVLFLGERDSLLERGWGRIRLEQGLAAGGIVLVVGLTLLGVVIGRWIANDFGELRQQELSVLALTLIGLGVQTVFGSFFLSILPLGLHARRVD
jgi:glycosyltransferase involved in cell wall biosynthesis